MRDTLQEYPINALNKTHRSTIKLSSVLSLSSHFTYLSLSPPHLLSPLFPKPHRRRSLSWLPGMQAPRQALCCRASSPSFFSLFSVCPSPLTHFSLSALFLPFFLSFFFLFLYPFPLSSFLFCPRSLLLSFSLFSVFPHLPLSAPIFLFLSWTSFFPFFSLILFSLSFPHFSTPPLSPQFCPFLFTSLFFPHFSNLLSPASFSSALTLTLLRPVVIGY